MNKSDTSGFPGMNAMNDTLEFMKNMWGGMSAPGMGIPGIMMPTLSVEEIDKQIKDLKAVESWLNVNMTMLRSTIQALEVQSATISTLQAMGQSFSDAVKQGAASSASSGTASSAGGFPFSTASPQATPDEPQKSWFSPEQTEEPEQASASGEDKESDDEPDARNDVSDEMSEDAGIAAPMANPAAWWNMLQDQFKQAVGTAMANEPTEPAARKAKPTAKSKPVSKSKAAPKSKPAPKAKVASKAKPAPKSMPAPKSSASAKPAPKAPRKPKE